MSQDDSNDWEDDLPPRPTNYSQCLEIARPCPYVSCRYHLYLDVDKSQRWDRSEGRRLRLAGWTLERIAKYMGVSTQAIQYALSREASDLSLTFHDSEVWELEETCAIDVANKGPHSLYQIARLMNVTPEAVRVTETKALAAVSEAKSIQDFDDLGED